VNFAEVRHGATEISHAETYAVWCEEPARHTYQHYIPCAGSKASSSSSSFSSGARNFVKLSPKQGLEADSRNCDHYGLSHQSLEIHTVKVKLRTWTRGHTDKGSTADLQIADLCSPPPCLPAGPNSQSSPRMGTHHCHVVLV
jgi:hypothetical protein